MGNKRRGKKDEQEIIREEIAPLFGFVHFDNRNHETFEIARSEYADPKLDDEGVDVFVRPEILFPYSIQIKGTLVTGKNSKSIDIQPLLRIKDKENPMLITKVDIPAGKRRRNLDILVSMRLEDFKKFWLAYHESLKK